MKITLLDAYGWLVYCCTLLAGMSLLATAWVAIDGIDGLMANGLLPLGQAGLHWPSMILDAWLFCLMLWAGLIFWLAAVVIVLLLSQGIHGFFLVTPGHNGLRRRKQANGYYEGGLPGCFWNGKRVVANLLLLQRLRHSNLHPYPAGGYRLLRHFDKPP